MTVTSHQAWSAHLPWSILTDAEPDKIDRVLLQTVYPSLKKIETWGPLYGQYNELTLWISARSVSEFNKFKPRRLKSPKNRFQLSAGLNLEKINTILSGTNHIWAAAQIL